MIVLSVLDAPNTKTNSLCVQTHLAIKLFWIRIGMHHLSRSSYGGFMFVCSFHTTWLFNEAAVVYTLHNELVTGGHTIFNFEESRSTLYLPCILLSRWRLSPMSVPVKTHFTLQESQRGPNI